LYCVSEGYTGNCSKANKDSLTFYKKIWQAICFNKDIDFQVVNFSHKQLVLVAAPISIGANFFY